MACNCHGIGGAKVGRTSPMDQCTTCARKHVKNAWTAWNELSYEDENRDYVTGQLRAAAEHLKFSHREAALRLRDVAVLLEENKDLELGNVADVLNALRQETLELFYSEHPDARERLEAIERTTHDNDHD